VRCSLHRFFMLLKAWAECACTFFLMKTSFSSEHEPGLNVVILRPFSYGMLNTIETEEANFLTSINLLVTRFPL